MTGCKVMRVLIWLMFVLAPSMSAASEFPVVIEIETKDSVVLDWLPPLFKMDGTPTDPIVNYVVYKGMVSEPGPATSESVGNVLTTAFTGLVPGVHQFAVRADDENDEISAMSPIETVEIFAPRSRSEAPPGFTARSVTTTTVTVTTGGP